MNDTRGFVFGFDLSKYPKVFCFFCFFLPKTEIKNNFLNLLEYASFPMTSLKLIFFLSTQMYVKQKQKEYTSV